MEENENSSLTCMVREKSQHSKPQDISQVKCYKARYFDLSYQDIGFGVEKMVPSSSSILLFHDRVIHYPELGVELYNASKIVPQDSCTMLHREFGS